VYQTAAGVDRVRDAPVEDAHVQPVEENLDPLADRAGGGRVQAEDALRPPRAVGVVRRIVEEGVLATPAGARFALIVRTRIGHDHRVA
jgi:hypothetical protein